MELSMSVWAGMTSLDRFEHYWSSGVIKAWLDGKELEAKDFDSPAWESVDSVYGPFNFPDAQFRIKPEPPLEPTKVQWVSIKKRSPPKPGVYLVYIPQACTGWCRVAEWKEDAEACRDYFRGHPDVTHWAPAPNIPGDET